MRFRTEPEGVLQARADTPFFCEVTNQMAANQVDNGVCERWKIVPAVAEVSAHTRRTSTTLRQSPAATAAAAGQENPRGQRSPARYSRHVHWSGNQDRNS